MTKFVSLLFVLLLSTTLGGCGGSSSGGNDNPDDNLSLRMQLPDSLTGGAGISPRPDIAKRIAGIANRSSSGEPCAYQGPEDENNPLRNGYETTRFMISIMATWTCIADLLIDLSAVVPHDGIIIETDNDSNAADYEADEPTHYSVTDESNTQVTLRMYYGYDKALPPEPGADAEFYISWFKTGDDVVNGRLIVDARAIDAVDRNSDDPEKMRMDFKFTPQQRSADMYLRFDLNNLWADGFRIQVTRDETASPLGQVFTARGLLKMTRQFLSLPGINEIPNIQLFTVSDLIGNGAAIEEAQNISLPLIVNIFRNNHLGNYLFTKRDVYFFEDDQDWEYIKKTVTSSTYRGARNTAASGGSWVPFNPSLDMIIGALSLDSDYFTGSNCTQVDDNCNQLLNAVFIDGFAGQEKNQGSDPMDWRSTALTNADYLSSVYPNGSDWIGAFEQNFTSPQ